jgi:hypothetical protein
MILGNLLSLVFLKVASLVPVQAARTGADWAQRMEGLFAEILKPMPSLFRWIVNYFFTSKFKDTERINRALERAKGSRPAEAYSPEWTARVILELLLQPIGVVFAIAYIGFFALVCLFWSFPFLR